MATFTAKSNITLFVGTFVSAFLLIFGLATLMLLYAPAIAAPFDKIVQSYNPQLPLSEDREEGFIDITKDPGKLVFPPLTSVEGAAAGNWIHIPSIGVAVPLALSPSINDEDVIDTLSSGAALYPNGIQPGRLGNVFIAAHSTGEPWRGKYRFAFLRINEVQGGNIIHLDYQGTRYTYRVTDSKTVKPSSDYTVPSDRPVPTVTLMACWPLWSTNQRMLVTAELTNITHLSSLVTLQ